MPRRGVIVNIHIPLVVWDDEVEPGANVRDIGLQKAALLGPDIFERAIASSHEQEVFDHMPPSKSEIDEFGREV